MSGADSDARRGTALKVVATAVIAAVLVVAGWVAAEVFVSPDQRAASIAAPSQGPLTATVEFGPLSETVAITGTAMPAVKVESPLPLSGDSVVTAAPAIGTVVTPGSVVIEISGRPVIAYAGDYPFYRELSEGDEGGDVRQLQENLAALTSGLAVDGIFGARTSSALASLYKKLGYDAPRPDAAPPADDGESVDAGAHGTVYFDPDEALVLEGSDLVLDEPPVLGTVLSPGAALGFRSGGVVVVADLDTATAAVINEGDHVQLTDSNGAKYSGNVESIVTDADSEQDERIIARITLEAHSGLLAPDDELIAVIETEKVVGESLLVPARAIVHRDNGAVVFRVGPDHTSVPIRVREVGTLHGTSAIEIIDGELAVGDAVETS